MATTTNMMMIRGSNSIPIITDNDQSSLLSLKNHITSDPYKFLSNNWSTTSNSSSFCGWNGVTCNSPYHRVTCLNLSNMDLTGTLPPNLGNLSLLVSLDLSGNNFHGSLPHELSQLNQNLQILSLKGNSFSGEIPSWLGSFHKLEIFILERNRFTGFIPPSIFNLTNLVELRLSYNSLQGSISEQIGNLHSLKILAIGYNQLSGSLPSALFSNISSLQFLSLPENAQLFGTVPYNGCDNLGQLKYLDLSRIKLDGSILSILSNCSQLQVLNLTHTYFGGVIPQEIDNLKALRELRLAYNHLTGHIPSVFSNFTMLRLLLIRDNIITGQIPREIFNISSLEHLSFTNNSISDSLPIHICESLPRLRWLSLGLNKLKGRIPSNLSRCSELRGLELVQNEFHGVIPKEIANLEKLQKLYVAWNNLEGFIPREFGNLTMLTMLYLGNNNLIGTIPKELGNLYKLQKLLLGYNNLEGPLPVDALANCKNLISLRMSNNPLNSVLPESFGNLSSSIQKFEASNCGIKGNIPNTIGNLRDLISLDLSQNKLSGSMPSSSIFLRKLQSLKLGSNGLNELMLSRICGLQSLSEVYMENNEISGPIPECFGNLGSLRYLSLGSNRLEGSIPTSLWNLANILEINLSTNLLSGSLPAEFGNMKAVISIDLSMNNILGALPISLGDLKNLQNIQLVHNRIEGSIPKVIGEIVSLESLNLSHNHLSGSIPKSLEKLQYLKYLDVSYNYLSGEIPKGGPFLNFTSESFASNKALCGEERFHVPPCLFRSNNKKEASRLVIILTGIAAFIGSTALALGLVYLIRYRKKSKVKNEDHELLHALGTMERVSYYELERATNGYHEQNLLGIGSFGCVYKGILGDGRTVAVKVFNLQFERVSKSFDVECMVLRQLRHRNLTKVISSCSNPDFKALVLEFMINGSLEQWLYSSNCSLSFMQRLNLMIDVACALDYLHSGYSTHVVHCDLKPSNILLDQDMVAHVSDFGIAKLLGNEDSVTQTETLATFGYLAPEYGLQGSVSTKCDVYSYGIILMEVFTRKKPNDEMLEGNLSLKEWVKDSFFYTLAPVIDSSLLSPNEEYLSEKLGCISSIMEVALNCTRESPKERQTMGDVIVSLEKIKHQLLPYYSS